MVALRYDKSEAVRLKALEGLQPYVAEDMRVRDAVLEALLNDSDRAHPLGGHQRTGAGGSRYRCKTSIVYSCQFRP